jgi:phytoene dehydrogenase-like protein
VLLRRSLSETVAGLGVDGPAYRDLLEPLVLRWEELIPELMGPVVHRPQHPLLLTAFGRMALRSARGLAEGRFKEERARALFAGAAAHSFLPLEQNGSAAFGLVLLLLGHANGWPFPRSGSQVIADALAAQLAQLGGEIETGRAVRSLDDLPSSRLVFCDVTPRQLLALARDRLPTRYRHRLSRWRYGPGAFKLDYALDGPIPWRAAEVADAGTVHLGGSLAEIAESERAAWEGRHSERPFVLLAQQSRFDPTRAPDGKHTVWAYCHVPHGSTVDMRERVEAQIERFAPGFRDRVRACSTRNSDELEQANANLVGGDISGGANTLGQVVRRLPHTTPVRGLYLCSASTAPGAGVHGMCGHHAALAALPRG